jgi:hypothetical protein
VHHQDVGTGLSVCARCYQNCDPLLPRYLFGTCWASSSQCTNFSNETYAESNLNRVTKLRGILKKDCAGLGMTRQWVLDGIGALMGVPVGESYGTNREIISELKLVMAKDGVHFDVMGSKKFSGRSHICDRKNAEWVHFGPKHRSFRPLADWWADGEDLLLARLHVAGW